MRRYVQPKRDSCFGKQTPPSRRRAHTRPHLTLCPRQISHAFIGFLHVRHVGLSARGKLGPGVRALPAGVPTGDRPRPPPLRGLGHRALHQGAARRRHRDGGVERPGVHQAEGHGAPTGGGCLGQHARGCGWLSSTPTPSGLYLIPRKVFLCERWFIYASKCGVLIWWRVGKGVRDEQHIPTCMRYEHGNPGVLMSYCSRVRPDVNLHHFSFHPVLQRCSSKGPCKRRKTKPKNKT